MVLDEVARYDYTCCPVAVALVMSYLLIRIMGMISVQKLLLQKEVAS